MYFMSNCLGILSIFGLGLRWTNESSYSYCVVKSCKLNEFGRTKEILH